MTLLSLISLITHPQADQAPITEFYNTFRRYPPNNKQWWIAKYQVTDGGHKQGDFNPDLLSKFYFGNTKAPRGHYVVEAFNVDRSAVSGVQGLPVERTSQRPVTTAFFSGRIWYGVGSIVYFSQVLDTKGKVGNCYQEADPTSEDINGVIATDGGVIPIPEMHQVVRIVPMGAGVVVFGTNGVWNITGTQAGFSATDISVSKLSPIGTESPNSIVETDTQIFYFSKVGIQVIGVQNGGLLYSGFQQSNITLTTIQTFFNEEIPESAKVNVKGFYDPATNTIQWLFKSTDVINNYFYDRVLTLDLTLESFFPWTVSSTSDRPYIVGGFVTPRLNQVKGEIKIIDETGTQVLDEIAENVIEEEFTVEVRPTFLKYLVAVPTSAGFKFTFGSFKNTNYADWALFSDDGVGYKYTSFLETGYELLGDAMRDKQARYVFCYFSKAEETFIPNGSGDLVGDRPSSCKFQIKWDWADTTSSNKWSTKIEAYRYNKNLIPDNDTLEFDTGFPVVVTKNKVRGNGKSIQFRFENSDIGTGFNLLGWSAAYSGNTQP